MVTLDSVESHLNCLLNEPEYVPEDTVSIRMLNEILLHEINLIELIEHSPNNKHPGLVMNSIHLML